MTFASTDTAAWLGILGQHAMLLLTDPNGRIHKASVAFCRASGYRDEELRGINQALLRAPQYVGDWWTGVWQRVGTGLPWRGQVCNLSKEGKTYWVDVQALPVVSSVGRIEGVLLLETDISHYLRMEQDLRRDKEQAETSSLAKGQFLAAMSHDIRTPMNAILGLLRLLQSTDLTQRQAEYASKTEGAARSLLGLINDILDFSKVESGKMVLDPQPFRVERLMRDLSVILSANLGQRPIELLFDIDPQLPPALIGDTMRLQQVLINLGGNAIKFTESGEVIVSLRLAGYRNDQAWVRMAVRDTGIGIAPEHQKNIFERFAQAEHTTSRRYGGTGLGLAICQRFVHLMGGEIQVQSRIGVGSEFFFEIPLPMTDPNEVDDALLLPDTGSLKPLRVLLVDDNLTALQLLADICRSLGWVVDVASSGTQALALLKRSQEHDKPYDLAVVDDQMPGISGWETVRLIRQRERFPLCRLLMITSAGRNVWEGRSDAERAWVNGVLVKPVTASMLFDAVVRYPDHTNEVKGVPSTIGARPRRLLGMRLLVVEDNAINQQVASELLAAEGASVTLAADGQQGVRAVLDSEVPFDVVLMDMEMPIMDGMAATHELRHVHGRNDLAIIAMTANAMESDRQACLAGGMNAHVGKPLDMEQLVQTLLAHAPPGFVRRPLTPTPTMLVRGQSDPEAVASAAASVRFVSSAVLDVDSALERLGGESDVYIELIDPFIEDSTHMLWEIKSALTKGETQDLCRHLHTLKGVAATMGANELSGLARQMESLVKAQVTTQHASVHVPSEDLAALDTALVAVHDALHVVLRQMHQHTSAPTGTTSATGLEVDVQLRDQLKHFAELLRNADLTALSLHRELQQHHAEILQPHAQLLAQSIHEFDFGRAATLCDALLANLFLKGETS